VRKRKQRFSKENWEKLIASVRQAPEVQAPKEESKVEVHIHNHPVQAEFNREMNSADIAMNRLREGVLRP